MRISDWSSDVCSSDLQAFEEVKNWDPSLTLSVNISPGQLKDPWLSQKILKLLVETGFPPNRLEVEITESSLFENLSLAQSIVGRSEEHTSELQSLMRISYAVFCLKKKTKSSTNYNTRYKTTKNTITKQNI